jgi:hypothetical protein
MGGVTKGDFVGKNLGASDIWVARYDQDGKQVWTVQLGTTETDFLQSIAIDDKGQVFIAGYTGGIFPQASSSSSSSASSSSSSSGGVSTFIAQLDGQNGDVVWLRQYSSQVN